MTLADRHRIGGCGVEAESQHGHDADSVAGLVGSARLPSTYTVVGYVQLLPSRLL